MAPDADALSRLQRLLGSPALADLRRRLRRAYEQAGAEAPRALRLDRLAQHEADALQALTGRAPRATASLQLDLVGLGQRLHAAGLAADLRAALEALDGPIAPLAALRSEASAAWARLAATSWHPAIDALVSAPRGLGLLKRLSRADPAAAAALCAQAARVLAGLPARGQPRAALAARCIGDAHALDDGEPIATLVLAALRRAPGDEGEAREANRALWAAQGIGVNELARPALSLNLPFDDGPPPDGQPRFWSLRQLLRRPPRWRVAGRAVYACENPNLVAMAADALGADCAPLVCSDGMPAAAQRTLLTQLAAAGAELHCRADFDWPGIVIGNLLLRELAARPWRFGAADYAAATAEAHPSARWALRGMPVSACWDAALAPAMQQAGAAVAEEALADTLLADLAIP